jgi:release factor glutamine methyltransferase
MLGLRNVLDLGEFILKEGPHPDSARLDAELLLRHALGKDRAWILAHRNRSIAHESHRRFSHLIERRKAGEPIQYITGEQEFYGLPFRVTPDVLIPRPETEHLAEKALQLASAISAPRIVDVGTGSGAIAVAVAHHLPAAQIAALDISLPALSVARENAQRNAVSERIRFLQSDLLAAVAKERFDLVVSNPPYVPAADRDSLSVEVRDHEPALALFAGDDGLDIYRRLIPDAFAVLEPGGYLLMEIGYGQSEPVAALSIQAGFDDINFVPDLQGILRVASARRP